MSLLSSSRSGIAAACGGAVLMAALFVSPGCSTSTGSAAEVPKAPPSVEVTASPVTKAAITRTLRVTGQLAADEQAEVSAEIPGRVVATPVERGRAVGTGETLAQLSPTQASAQLVEAEANAATFEASLGMQPGGQFDVERVPDVATAKAQLALAQADFTRIRSLLEQKVVSQAEYDQLRTRVEAAQQKYEAERNTAAQRYRSWQAAQARITLAQKSLGDTRVKAPFAGVVAERRVSVGDFVGVGTVVATVVRIDPLRVELTVPEQYVARVSAGQAVNLRVDAYPERVFTGTVRFVSPSLRPDQRALTVEAIVANPKGELKPGFFVTAEVVLPDAEQALLVDPAALRQVGDTSRVFAIVGERVEDRIVTTGQQANGKIEITSGLRETDRVAVAPKGQLADGVRIRYPGITPSPAGGRP
jgi:RND family efflux transporter MFP subunit